MAGGRRLTPQGVQDWVPTGYPIVTARRGYSEVVHAPVRLIRLAHPFAAWANTRMKRPGRRGGHSLGKC
eukprot:SAG25_NODE_691_length_5916_cov_9.126698_5_plen_69_part_00